MSRLFEKLIRPALFRLDPETAHEAALRALETGLGTEFAQKVAESRYSVAFPYKIERFGLGFTNPLGVAAGFDKNGRAVNQLASLGFGFVEVGTVTLRPQGGNERPRLFRLPTDQALINRLGFNNDGAATVAGRLAKLKRKCLVGVNIGRNKDVPNEEAVENYLGAFEILHPVADYLAINVSSPNTPNLRELQRAESLDDLLGSLQRRNGELGAKPLLVKIGPDLSDSEIVEVVDVCRGNGIAGIIATNTTTSRESLSTPGLDEIGSGGVSGRPIARRSTEVIRKIYVITDGTMPVIGVGGVFDAKDAFEKIAAGASLVQAYTGFVYRGPAFASDLNRKLLDILAARGFETLDAAVGSSAK